MDNIFIELTHDSGEKFLAGLSHIQRLIDSKDKKPNQNAYIVGLNNNGGFYIRETYEEVKEKLAKVATIIL